MDRPTRGSPQRPDRIIMAELNPTQKALLENARGRVEQARMNLEGAEHMYKELVGMAMPVGCNGSSTTRHRLRCRWSRRKGRWANVT